MFIRCLFKITSVRKNILKRDKNVRETDFSEKLTDLFQTFSSFQSNTIFQYEISIECEAWVQTDL